MTGADERAGVVADVTVDAPAERVWGLLVDWERHDEWMLGTHMSDVSGAAPTAATAATTDVGTELAAVTGIGRFAFTDTMRVTTWDPPRRCTVVHTGRLVRGEGVFEVVELPGDRSRVIWSERLDLPLGALGRLGWPLVRPLVVAGLTWSLRRLAKLAERESHRR